MTFSASIVSDVWPPKNRSMVMIIWSTTVYAGPCLGPVLGGFMTVSGLHAYWIFILMALLSGTVALLVFFFLPETYVPFLLHLKAQRMQAQAEIGDQRYHSKHSDARGNFSKTLHVKFLILQPCRIYDC